MIIKLLDPGLNMLSGHHLEWDRLIAAELCAQGHELAVHSHLNIAPEARAALPKQVELVPTFRNYPYINPLRIDPTAGELFGFIDVALMLARDLRSVAKADLWLWPSLFPAQLYACTLANPGAPIAGCIHTEPNFMSSLGRASWRYALVKAGKAGLRMNIGVPGPALQQEYEPLFGDTQPLRLLPLPCRSHPGSAPKTRLRTIGFFGHQRQEKGIACVPELASVLLKEGYQVVLHDSGQGSGSAQPPGLTRIGYVPDLAAEIAKCDLVVLPYDAERYRYRESSIVWEALASAVPVVVPDATASGLRVLTSGAGKVFHAPTVDGIHGAVAEAKADYPQIAAAAFRTSQEWSEANGIAKLAHAFTAGVAA